MNVEVGQKVFAVFRGYGYGAAGRTQELTVGKIGRKWAYCVELGHRFDIVTGVIDGWSGSRVYQNEAAFRHEQSLDELWKEIHKLVDRAWYRPKHLAMNDLLKLKAMLSPPESPNE